MEFNYALLAKYITDELSTEELEEVMEWRGLSAENEKFFFQLMELHLSWNFIRYNTSEHIEQKLEEVNDRISKRSRFRIVRTILQYAAVILLLFSFSYLGWDYLRSEDYMTISVKSGEGVKKITLADGSSVWLKAGALLKVPKLFDMDNRKLFLQGEAFFDVVSDLELPFYVETDYLTIKVLGTAFNVKTNENIRQVEAVLARGKVALLDKQGNAVLDMCPGEKVTYDDFENEYVTEVVDVNICTAWRLNQFIFENVTLREIVNQLSVKFDVNINLESSELAQRRFRCVINEDESLLDILEQLKYLGSIQYRIEGKEIFIRKNSDENLE